MNERPEGLGIDAMLNAVDSTARKYPVLMGQNLGSPTLKLNLPIADFIAMSKVRNKAELERQGSGGADIAQRELIPNHSRALARYTLMGLVRSAINDYKRENRPIGEDILGLQKELGDPPYAALQPIVVNLENVGERGENLKYVDLGERINEQFNIAEVSLSRQNKMAVVDGQHRADAFKRVENFLAKVNQEMRYPKKGIFEGSTVNGRISYDLIPFWLHVEDVSMSRVSVCVECHLGLNIEQEQQLFFDLNSKVAPVSRSLGFQMDHTDPINKFVATNLIEENFFSFKMSDKDTTNWNNDDGSISRKDINTISSLICCGKASSKGLTPISVEKNEDFMMKFWEAIRNVKGFGLPNAKKTTIAAQPVVLKALAKLCYDLKLGHRNIIDPRSCEKLLAAIKTGSLDLSHNNIIWQALLMPSAERNEKFEGISKYVHVPIDANLDAGIFDKENNWVRFGNRHNDIYPRLGDIIRYKLGFKPRDTVTKAIAKEAQINVTT